MTTLRRTFAYFVLLVTIPAVLGAKGKCRKDPPDVDGDGDVVVDDVQDVESELQVVSATPGTVQPATPTDIKVYGAGFDSGASVKIGSFGVGSVQFIDQNTLAMKTPGLPEGTHDVVVTNPGGTSSTLKAGIRAVASRDDSCSNMAMYFELDSASLSASARSALDQALPCLRQRSRIRIEGHADERGTTDYNLALGQRRAEAVQRYLVTNGVPSGKLPVVSYGEERPADPSHTQSAWAKNRRVDMIAQ